MLTFGPSAMQRLLQQNETIKQTMTGLRYRLELAVAEMQQYSEHADLATKPDVQSLETKITALTRLVENIEPDVQSLETKITALTRLVEGIEEMLEGGGDGTSSVD